MATYHSHVVLLTWTLLRKYVPFLSFSGPKLTIRIEFVRRVSLVLVFAGLFYEIKQRLIVIAHQQVSHGMF